jgi:hypothetical protein
MAGAARSAHSRSLRGSGALRRRVLEPGAERAGKGAEGQRLTDDARRARRVGARVRRACQGRLGAAHPQSLCSRFQLECPKCKGPMGVIALIEDPGVVRRILEPLGRWAPEATERGPPVALPPGRRTRSFPLPTTPSATSPGAAREPRVATLLHLRALPRRCAEPQCARERQAALQIGRAHAQNARMHEPSCCAATFLTGMSTGCATSGGIPTARAASARRR